MKISHKLFLGIIAIVIPIVIILGAGSFYTAEKELTKDILDELDSVATIEKLRVNESISRNFERLDLILSNNQLSTSLANYLEIPNEEDHFKINKILNESKAPIPDISNLHILDSNGIVIFSTNEKYLEKSYLNSPTFQNSHYSKTINVDSENNENFSILEIKEKNLPHTLINQKLLRSIA